MNKNLNFKVKSSKGENIYPVSTPNTGQLIQIEKLKTIMTGGQYGAMISNRTLDAKEALDKVDIVANLTVLCPKLIKELKMDSWTDMDPMDFKELEAQYNAQFKPWYDEFKAELRLVPELKEKEEQDVTTG